MSDLSLSSLQAEIQAVAIEAAKSTQAIAHQTLHSIVVPALKNSVNR